MAKGFCSKRMIADLWPTFGTPNLLSHFPFLTVAWGPYAFFRVLEESGASAQPANTVDTQNVQTSESHIENQQDERNRNTFMGISIAGDSSSNVQDLELGRR
ncbi:unnamed protein product [Ilex paraguariensis]|uniref:Uncharacterized protein n=1 Tax=Ilex paraguariensis TaxID=185542 RepID=A0ABC8S1C9_9AQUA